MRKLRLITTILFFLSLGLFISFTNKDAEPTPTEIVDDAYNKGWSDGYCEGWKQIKGQYAICPISPLAPLPKIECSSGYKCGYNRGFRKGMYDAQ